MPGGGVLVGWNSGSRPTVYTQKYYKYLLMILNNDVLNKITFPDSVFSVILLQKTKDIKLYLWSVSKYTSFSKSIYIHKTVFDTECALPFSHKGIVGLKANGAWKRSNAVSLTVSFVQQLVSK